MSDPIEPALTARQWGPMPPRAATFRLAPVNERKYGPKVAVADGLICITDDYGEAEYAPLAAVIAIANHALSDDDPRKVTPAMVKELRRVAGDLNAFKLWPIAAALESFLPPAERSLVEHTVKNDNTITVAESAFSCTMGTCPPSRACRITADAPSSARSLPSSVA